MELEFHQLDRRYEELRARCPARDKRVLASLARDGQQLPVVVIAGGEGGRFILIDGFKRVRGLIKLRYDTVHATCWELSEVDALLLVRQMQSAEGESALEQGWLLRELRGRFELSVHDLAQRFDRSPSWVSRRLGLVTELPEPIQELVRRGLLVPHAAMKFLLPLARANKRGAVALAAAIAPLRPSTRQTEAACLAFARGNDQTRQYLLSHPEHFVAHPPHGLPASSLLDKCPATRLTQDLGGLGGIARRARARVAGGVVRELLPPERSELGGRFEAARGDVARLFHDLEQELAHVGRADEDHHS